MDSLLFQPLRFHLGAYQDGSLSHFERSFRFKSTAKIDGLVRASAMAATSSRWTFEPPVVWLLWILDVKQFVGEAKLRVITNVVGHGGDLLRELFLPDGTPRNTFCCLVHCVNHDAVVIEGQNAIGLITVGERNS